MKTKTQVRIGLCSALLLASFLAPNRMAPVRAEDGYPAVVSKKLYASRDLRGKKAPTLEVADWLNGKPVTDGKVVLIDFWATWCPDCRQFIPELNSFKKKFGKELVIVALSDEPRETVEKFARENKLEYSMAVDPSRKMFSAVGVTAIPHVLIVSPDHIVRWQGDPASKEDLLTVEKLGQIISHSNSH